MESPRKRARGSAPSSSLTGAVAEAPQDREAGVTQMHPHSASKPLQPVSLVTSDAYRGTGRLFQGGQGSSQTGQGSGRLKTAFKQSVLVRTHNPSTLGG